MSRTEPTHDLGPTYCRTDHARFETKPGDGTGAGYERWRSYEWRPETPRQAKEDVYVSVHRLAAVSWCYPDEMAVSEILAHLDGKDVHHRSGIPYDNREGNLAVRDHGRHSEITQAQMRAFAEDAKRSLGGSSPDGTPTAHEDGCDRCGQPADVLATSEDWTGEYCLDCATDASDGAAIEV